MKMKKFIAIMDAETANLIRTDQEIRITVLN